MGQHTHGDRVVQPPGECPRCDAFREKYPTGRRVIVCGGRRYADTQVVDESLAALLVSTDIVVTGGASGADRLAKEWAEAHGLRTETYPAQWTRFGNAAGPIRNRYMASLGVDAVVAFPGGRGTADMIRVASELGVPVHRVGDVPHGERHEH